MKDMIAEAKRLVVEGAPEIIEAVALIMAESATPGDRTPLLFMLERFDNDPMLLYASILYATSQGVTVTFQPSTRQKDNQNR